MRDASAMPASLACTQDWVEPSHTPRVMVMDACSLTGVALCDLAAGGMSGPPGRYLSTLSDLAAAVAQSPWKHTLVITELFSASEGVSAGLTLLARLVKHRPAGLRVVVCTAVTDPMLLRLVLALQPSAIVLRRERLSVLSAAIGDSSSSLLTRLSPGVTAQLTRSREAYFTPREKEWLLTQVDGLGLQASAARPQIKYKTAAGLRYRVMQRLGDNATTFAQRMATLREQTGFSL
ncbi:hypothetical protein [Enterobacter vonholyi]